MPVPHPTSGMCTSASRSYDLWAAYRHLSAAGVRFKSEPVSPTTGPNQGGWAVYLKTRTA